MKSSSLHVQCNMQFYIQHDWKKCTLLCSTQNSNNVVYSFCKFYTVTFHGTQKNLFLALCKADELTNMTSTKGFI
jgi:hypothetical protein